MGMKIFVTTAYDPNVNVQNNTTFFLLKIAFTAFHFDLSLHAELEEKFNISEK